MVVSNPSSGQIGGHCVERPEWEFSGLDWIMSDSVSYSVWTGMDVDTKLGFGWSPLMCAVNVADCELAELLLNRGANASFSKG